MARNPLTAVHFEMISIDQMKDQTHLRASSSNVCISKFILSRMRAIKSILEK